MAEENPQNFYSIMSYAFILEVSDIWIKKLKRIMETNPNLLKNKNYLSSDFTSFTQKMQSLSRPSYENGGIDKSSGGGGHSHGGGGHSGGGGGGGGGHSW